MSLPKGFQDPRDYFCQVNEFLKKNSWIYREANTEFLRAGILKEMPQDFKNYFLKAETLELNNFPYVHEPLANLEEKALIDFRQNLANLIPSEAYNEPRDFGKSINLENPKKMNVKKQHEIQRLNALVKECLKIQNNVDEDECRQKCVLIDFGCGLGYLSELLYKTNENLLILGLEADTYRVESAVKRMSTYMPTAINSIHYRQHFVTENSKEFIVKTVEEVFKLNYQHAPEQTATKMVIIGLHACADLTITSMKLFLQVPQVQQLIIMPCCYHKLQVCDDGDGDVAVVNTSMANLKFKNFPMSETLKQVLLDNKAKQDDNVNFDLTNESFTTYEYSTYLNRPFLRLACQQTLKRWRKCSALEHQAHGSEMFLRGVAELLKQEQEDREWTIAKRKEEKIDLKSLTVEETQSFETFSRIYALKNRRTQEIVAWSEKHRKQFYEIIEKYPGGNKLAEGLTCLQTSMQKLCENLVLYDRLNFMEETAYKMNLKINVRYEKIMDEGLSPRCYVLIAEKL